MNTVIIALLLFVACCMSVSVVSATSYYWWSNQCGIASDDISDCTQVKLKPLTDDNGVRINIKYKGAEIKAAKNKKIHLVIEGTIDPMEEFKTIPSSTIVTTNKNKFKLQKDMGKTLKNDATAEIAVMFGSGVELKTTKVFYKEV